MKIFVTGATGFIGEAVVKELFSRGHSVIGLARSKKSANKLKNMGADVLLGSLEDLDVLTNGAKQSDGVIHLAFTNDFNNFQNAVKLDINAINAIADGLAGSNKPFVNTSGTLMVTNLGRPATEQDQSNDLTGRGASDQATLNFANRGIRSMSVRLAPTVHNEFRQGFGTVFSGIALKNQKSAYVRGVNNVWPSVHQLDAAKLFVDALERGKSGAVYNAVTEESIPFKSIAIKISELLNIPATPISANEAMEYAGPFFGNAMQIDNPTSAKFTREELGWTPTHATLFEDLTTFLNNPIAIEQLKKQNF